MLKLCVIKRVDHSLHTHLFFIYVRICIIDNFPGAKINLVGFSEPTLKNFEFSGLLENFWI
jgi:hypothetical protein